MVRAPAVPFNSVPGVIGSLQALEVLKIAAGIGGIKTCPDVVPTS